MPGDANRFARAFLPVLEEDSDAFEEVYAALFEVLDREWLAAGATYMVGAVQA